MPLEGCDELVHERVSCLTDRVRCNGVRSILDCSFFAGLPHCPLPNQLVLADLHSESRRWLIESVILPD